MYEILSCMYNLICSLFGFGHGGTVVTHSPPTSEVGGSNPGPCAGKLLVAYHWLAFTVQNLDQLCVLVSSAQKIMTCTVLKGM